MAAAMVGQKKSIQHCSTIYAGDLCITSPALLVSNFLLCTNIRTCTICLVNNQPTEINQNNPICSFLSFNVYTNSSTFHLSMLNVSRLDMDKMLWVHNNYLMGLNSPSRIIICQVTTKAYDIDFGR